MTNLGNVTGAITLTLNGHTEVHENVFGGGNEGFVSGNSEVIIQDE